MRYQVPQFIEMEDKIFGPLTLKQFIYIAGGAGLCFAIWKLLNIYLAILLIPVVGIFSASLAFYKPNNKPFINMVESFFKYAITGKLYIWKKEEKKPVPADKVLNDSKNESSYIPKLSDSKLKELTWSLDINENLEPSEKSEGGK